MTAAASEPSPVQLLAPAAKHRPPPFSLSSLPFIPRLYTPQPDPLPFEPFITAPTSPVPAAAVSVGRAEPMSPPSPLSSVTFSSASEEEDEERKRRRIAVPGIDDMDDDPLSALDTARSRSLDGSVYFSPLASPVQSTSLTPMVAALHTASAASSSAAVQPFALTPASMTMAALALPTLLSPLTAQWGMSPFLFERQRSDVMMEV